MTISVIVPAYNCEESLPLLVNRLEPVLQQVADEFELLLVNDGSVDRTWDVIREIESRLQWVKGINLLRNFGQHNALLCGTRQARYEVIVTMDDDLQHPPEAIPALLSELENGYDVVYGTPKVEQHGVWRDLASIATKVALRSAMGIDVARKVSGFRVFRTAVRTAFADYCGPNVNIDVLLTWGAAKFSAVSVDIAPRQFGQSNYTFRKLLTHAMNMVTGFSILPLQAASLLGLLSSVVGAAALAWVFIVYLVRGAVVPGFAFLASAIAVFSGVQLFALGIIGEYLARMHFRAMGKPPYAIEPYSEARNREGSHQ